LADGVATGITLDQLRMLLAAVDEGSFTGAGRKLRRVQSAVSHGIASLEEELGFPLFTRGGARPKLTAAGEQIARAARRVCAETDALRRLAEDAQRGLEARVSVAVDALFPPRALVRACREFAARYPSVELRVTSDTLDAVASRVREGRADLGVVSGDADTRGLVVRGLTQVRLAAVAAPAHPLAQAASPIPTGVLAEHVQIVLTGTGEGAGPDRAVLSPRTWRVGDLTLKHALLRGGLGWGNLPTSRARRDLRRGSLVALEPEAWSGPTVRLPLLAVRRAEGALGEASGWLLGRLGEVCDAAALPLAKKTAPPV
jgi:DNA-binding transcriptional LysR family regulator